MTRNQAELEFDNAVRAVTNAEWDRPWSTQASPDGIGSPDNGLWRIYHNCAAPKVGHVPRENGNPSDTLECSGCGQRLTYIAEGGRG